MSERTRQEAAQTTRTPVEAQPEQIEQQEVVDVGQMVGTLMVTGSPPASPGTVLQLQRLIGNQATLQLLQRQIDDEAAQHALRYYREHSDQFTPDIIHRIQRALNRPESPTMTREDVLAVAEFQEIKGIPVDGIAGGRTLAVLFPSGLAAREHIEAYAEDAGEARGRWDETPQHAPGISTEAVEALRGHDRFRRLLEAANARLAALGIPPLQGLGTTNPDELASFDSESWTLWYVDEEFQGGELTDERYADLANTVYHESRHAEQYYRVAQLLAARGMSVADISAALHDMDEDVVADAAAHPMALDSIEAIIAERWYQELRTDIDTEPIDAHIEQALERLGEAKRAYHRDPTPETEQAYRQAIVRYHWAMGRYHARATEIDAFRQGDAVAAELNPDAGLDDAD